MLNSTNSTNSTKSYSYIDMINLVDKARLDILKDTKKMNKM